MNQCSICHDLIPMLPRWIGNFPTSTCEVLGYFCHPYTFVSSFFISSPIRGPFISINNSQCLSSECLIHPPYLHFLPLLTFLSASCFFFLFFFLSLPLPCPLLLLLRYYISLWCKLPTVGLTWTLYAETIIVEINYYYCMTWRHPPSSVPHLNSSLRVKVCGSRSMCW